MVPTVASNRWAEIIHHASDGIPEQRWLPGQMTEGAFKASLAPLALRAALDGPAIFPMAWFSGRSRAIAWLKSP